MSISTRIARIAVGAILSVAVFATGLAMAQNVHLKPPNRNPTFQDLGLALQASGNLAGLGSGDVVISVTAQANVTATCTNPGGGTQPPGQNPAPLTVTGSVAIPEGEIKNGNLAFTVQTQAPPTTIAGAPGCPNPQWTETIEDLAFTSAVITVQQGTGMPIPTVLTVSCTFSAPTANGVVPAGNVTCTSG
jgi:hypothetical protein